MEHTFRTKLHHTLYAQTVPFLPYNNDDDITNSTKLTEAVSHYVILHVQGVRRKQKVYDFAAI